MQPEIAYPEGHHVSQEDSQQPDRGPAPRFSRDTILLLGALAFLILAVALTFLFTPNNGTQTGQAVASPTPGDVAPSIAVVSTPIAGTGYPVPTTGTGSYPSPVFGTGGYPEPGASESALGGGYPEPADQTATAAAPNLVATGDPSAETSPTRAVAGGQPNPTNNAGTVSPTFESSPVPEGTAPAQPTFRPTVTTPTNLPVPPPPTSTTGLGATQAQPVAPSPTVGAAQQPTTTLEPTTEPKESPPTSTPAPTVPPADVLRGNVRWSIDQSPITLHRDVQIAPGAELIIEPGVEVRLDAGVSIYVDGGRLLSLGMPNLPVRFNGSSSARWSGIYGRPNSFIQLDTTEIHGGGIGGTVLAVDKSSLVVRGSHFNDNGGAILLTDTKLEMRDTEVAGNDMPFGAALDASYARGNSIVLQNNRFGGNILSGGSPMVRFANQSTFETLNLDIQGNLLRGGAPNLQLNTNGPIAGRVACNTLIGDAQGFGLRTQTIQVEPNGTPPFALTVDNNYIDEHIPPVIPYYLKFGIGRGATSEVMLDMRNNWWGDASGPYEPDENADGRGDSVGENILFAPWLTQAPSCAPPR